MKRELIIGCSFAAMAAGYWLYSDRGCDEIEAYKAVQSEIAKHLKSPSSAVYPKTPTISGRSEYICNFSVHGHFDSANIFGAMLRGTYKAEVLGRDDGTWRVVLWTINGEIPGS